MNRAIDSTVGRKRRTDGSPSDISRSESYRRSCTMYSLLLGPTGPIHGINDPTSDRQIRSSSAPFANSVGTLPLWVRRWLAAASLMAVAAPALHAQANGPDWVPVTDRAGWQARDSQGEVVFRDRLWILGGWYSSFKPAPRDVWSSVDGRDWTLVTPEAPWKHSDLPMSIVFRDRMWMMGGWYNGRLPDRSAGNEVWHSEDGANWQQATARAQWSPRLAAAVVVFKGRMWLLGGSENYYFGHSGHLRNDVWASADGKDWTLATADAGWPPRAYHQAVVFNERIYVFGGGNYEPGYIAFNDVWSSADGVGWKQETPAAAWPSRLWFSSAVYRGCMWVLGGWSNLPSMNHGDVWYSQNGRDWTRLKSNVTWKARHEHSAYVFQDRLWVAGGSPLSSDAWSLQLPADWKPAASAGVSP